MMLITDEAAFVTLMTLVVTTAGGVVTQLMSMRKQERAAKAILEQTKADAELLAAQTKAAAVLVKTQADRVADQSQEAREELREHLLRASRDREAREAERTQEIKVLVQENTALTETGTEAARQAYRESNAVNTWRNEVTEQIRKLTQSLHEVKKTLPPPPPPPPAGK
jgi:hypothetical protein